MMPGRVHPPAWNEDTLRNDRLEAIANFVRERTAEGGARYRAILEKSLADAQALFLASNDLQDFGSGTVLATRPNLSAIARYLCGPPISADDLDTIAGEKLAMRKRLTIEDARRLESVIKTSMDRDRFPWLFDPTSRAPTVTEREVGIKWTAGLKAAQEVATGRRGESSKRQQQAVRALLKQLGFTPVRKREVNSVRDLDPGEYCETEVRVVGTNCDVAIGLWDGWLLLCECKVSNSGVNSVKRLNRECGDKAATWRNAFGSQAITAAVLAGVYELHNLLAAQHGPHPVVIFWEHRLSALADFVKRAK